MNKYKVDTMKTFELEKYCVHLNQYLMTRSQEPHTYLTEKEEELNERCEVLKKHTTNLNQMEKQ